MSQTPAYLVELWKTRIDNLFEGQDQEDVLDWLIANHGRKRVILVGAGFSRNADNPRSVRIPLWKELTKEFAADLRVDADAFDALTLADFYRRNLGSQRLRERLLAMLDDAAISPGEAHRAMWGTKPEAVITTNFLDTLLDRGMPSHKVVRNPDLAMPLTADATQVIYIHGHRDDPDSWVVGRNDYEDVVETRPMLFARTRQLFAQFPLLVVGYSLTDPDFHFVYRQMVRAMDRSHPMGLAVILSQTDTVSHEERAAKKYWEDLNLRIVRFKHVQAEATRTVTASDKFVRFFEVTADVTKVDDLKPCFKSPHAHPGLSFDGRFEHNVGMLQSAFGDSSLDKIWYNIDDSRAKLWRLALDLAFDEKHVSEFDRAATTSSRSFALPEDAFRGTRALGETRESANPTLTPDRWNPLPSKLSAQAFELLNKERTNPLVWKLDALLAEGVRQPVLDWVKAGFVQDILDNSGRVVTLSCVLLLLSGGNNEAISLVRRLGVPRAKALAELVGDFNLGGHPNPLSTLLVHARNNVMQGTVDVALQHYNAAIDELSKSTDADAPLLTYFAHLGRSEALPVAQYSRDAFEDHENAAKLTQQAKLHPAVGQWLRRIERLQTAQRTERLKSLERRVAQKDYEARGFSISTSTSALRIALEEASSLGAPVSVLRDLSSALLGQFGDLQDELLMRMRLDLGTPGEWLRLQVRDGDIFRLRRNSQELSVPFGASERNRRVESLSSVLLPQELPLGSLRARAFVNVLEHVPDVLAANDIERASTFLLKRYLDKSEVSEAAVVGLARVCGLSDVTGILDATEAASAPSDLAAVSNRFPWKQWAMCESLEPALGFLERQLLYVKHPSIRLAVGLSLAQILEAVPEAQRVIDACHKFWSALTEQVTLGGQGEHPTDVESVAIFCVVSYGFSAQHPEVREWLYERLELPEIGATIRGILLQAGESSLRAPATSHLLRAEGNRTLQEFVKLAQFEGCALTWESVEHHIAGSWSELYELAPVLNERFWKTETDWKSLREALRFGGQRRKAASWLIARTELLSAALDYTDSRESILSEGATGLGFLRAGLVDSLAHGDGAIANHAIYALGRLALHALNQMDADSISSALRHAANDFRIGVVHGAAYVANHLVAYSAGSQSVAPQILDAAAAVQRSLADDALAVVRRQGLFGAKVGSRDAQGSSKSGAPQ